MLNVIYFKCKRKSFRLHYLIKSACLPFRRVAEGKMMGKWFHTKKEEHPFQNDYFVSNVAHRHNLESPTDTQNVCQKGKLMIKAKYVERQRQQTPLGKEQKIKRWQAEGEDCHGWRSTGRYI